MKYCRSALTLIAVALVLTGACMAAQVSVLYNFAADPISAEDCPGFGLPAAPIFDGKGNLYGTCNGITGGGVVYELTPNATVPWTRTLVYDNGLNLGNPNNSLIFDSKGNLYGTDNSGGDYGRGSVFELSPPAVAGAVWTYTRLYSFLNTGTDGQYPSGGVIFDGKGNLYGTTNTGGTNGTGTVFELLAPAVAGGVWTEQILYNFGVSGGGDGANPKNEALVFDTHGNLYGETYGGGTNPGSKGIAFELMPQPEGSWTEVLMHTFAEPGSADGQHPAGSLIIDKNGNVYGVTSSGTGFSTGSYGVVYELSPAAGGTWTETILHNFTGQPLDGSTPMAGLVMDSNGNLFGTTDSGGANGFDGAIYELSPNGSTWIENILFSFQGAGVDTLGYVPQTSLTLDSTGNLYGVTSEGGVVGGTGSGAVYEYMSTPTAALPTFIPDGGTFNSTQIVTVDDITAGVILCVTTDGTTPTATTPGTCSHGSALSSGQTVTVSTSETVMALATEIGYVNSAVASALFTILPPPPTISSLSPFVTNAGGGQFTLTVNGSNFASGAVVNWGSTVLTTSFVSATQLSSAVPATLILNPGTVDVTVTSSAETSAPAAFTILGPTVTFPIIVSLSPSSVTAGGTVPSLTVNGANFAGNAVVLWNGAALKTTYVSGNQLTAIVPGTDLLSAGTGLVTVLNPAPAKAISAAHPFAVLSAVPTITAASLEDLADGSGNRALVLSGTNFESGSTVDWNGSGIATTFINPWTISAVVTGAEYATRPATVKVTNPPSNISNGFEVQ
jgi:uncharacterized repeat protein (TIGR03803 family)